MAAALIRKQSRRKALRVRLTELIDEGATILDDEEGTLANITGLKTNILRTVSLLEELDNEIVNSVEPDNVEDEVSSSMKFLDPVFEFLERLKLKTEFLSPSNKLSSMHAPSTTSVQCRLPKLELPVFGGYVLEWQGFWDQFNVAIHENESISDIDRFNYLKRYLSGQALACISGLSLSSANYQQAIKLLQERYGNPQVLISAHMESLLKLSKVTSMENVKALRKLYNDIENCVRNLRSLNVETATYGCLLIPILKERLPDELIVQISRRFSGERWTLDLLLMYFQEELQASESCFPVLKRSADTDRRATNQFSASSLLGQVDSEFSGAHKVKCLYCHSDHLSSRCKTVTNIQSRKDILFKEKRCFICLGIGHQARRCKSNYTCRKCKDGKHHISICTKSVNHVLNTASNEVGDNCQCSQRKSTESQVTHHDESALVAHVSENNSVLLQTARAQVFTLDSSLYAWSRVLFDSGSQKTYISYKMRKTLGLKTIRRERVVIKTFMNSVDNFVKTLDVVKFKVKFRHSDDFVTVEALCVDTLCSPISNQNLSKAKEFGHISNLELADFVDGSSTLEVGILIGVDFYYSFLSGRIIKGDKGPVASESVLGWVLSGPLSTEKLSSYHCFETHVMRCDTNHENDILRSDLQRFWEVENIGVEQDCVVTKFENNIFHNGSRYVAELPFKPDHEPIPDNFNTCKSRLKSLKCKLIDKGLERQYDRIFSEYEKQNIIQRVPECEISKGKGEVHYLPHRPVVRMDKETTKIRAVFDASCAFNGPSLNDCLYPGPNLILKIFDILLRFRFNAIGLLADIKQAFLNIEVAKKHVDFLRFLWYDINSSDETKVIVYRFLRVVFGVNCSPFILNGTIRQHLERYSGNEKNLIERLLKDFYVDDMVSGCEDTESGKMFYSKVRSIMMNAGFDLRKWVTNDKELRSYIESELVKESISNENGDSATYFETMITKGDSLKRVLGVEWDTLSDEFVFRFDEFLSKCNGLKLTKRNILSVSASIFDPLGFVSPITAKLKTIFQLLCKDKLGWNDEIPAAVKVVWDKLLTSLSSVNTFRINRFCFVAPEEFIQAELHGFCDSSLEVYCAVVYLRLLTKTGVKLYFLAAKSKVAPLKTLTIPRLELLGCVLLSKLVEEVKFAISDRIKLSRVFCWSDSEVALCWIKGKEKSWKPWVENRVVKVRKVVSRDNWFYVKGDVNPADIPTRLLVDFDFLFAKRWFGGPDFLLSNSFSNSYKFDIDSVKETHNCAIEHASLMSSSEVNNMDATSVLLSKIIDIKRYSSLDRLIKVTGYVFRFISNLKNSLKKSTDRIIDTCLQLDEYQNALTKWLQCEQNVIKEDSNYHKLESSLKLFSSKDGLLRLRGRFQNANISDDKKYPILLRSESYFTTLIIRDAHERVMHHGLEATLATIRHQYWITRGRKTIKCILRKCVTCKKIQGRTMRGPCSPDLPKFRINQFCRAFQVTGIDYAGPLFVKTFNRQDSLKTYLLLFTCANSRAVHLELVYDMSSSHFIRAFKRFVARRGVPEKIVQDNFKTFKSFKVKNFLLYFGIKQQFILPASPWWGGFYERMVRSVKLTLKKILKKSFITFEEMQTVLCEVEAFLNSRPLTYISEDDLEEPLTPNHLMYGQDIAKPVVVPQLLPQMNKLNLTKRVRHIQHLSKQFWKKFVDIYLNELKQKHIYDKKKKDSPEMLITGDVVLIRDDLPLPRQNWRMGRVQRIIYGKDGKARGAELFTVSKQGKSTTSYRPLQKLIPFEISEFKEDPIDKEAHVDNGANNKCKMHDQLHSDNSRLRRQAAIDGQCLRRLRQKYL